MLRLAFDFIITWRETRTRPNAYGWSLPIPGLNLSLTEKKETPPFVWSMLWNYWTSPENGIRIILPDASIITRVLTKT